MKSTFKPHIFIVILVLFLAIQACGQSQPSGISTPVPTGTEEPTKVPEMTEAFTPPPESTDTPMANLSELTHMWATTGEATSEYGDLDWSALQIGGAPNTPLCSDNPTAWAAADPDSLESLTAYYMELPLIPAEINIVQSYNPSQVVKVELIDAYAAHSDAIIYKAEPKATTECPYTLSIPVIGIDYPVMGVRITIDQSVLGLGRNEIDAVEMVGIPESGFEPEPEVANLPEGIWGNVYALPIYPTAENVNYQNEMVLSYTAKDNNRQSVLDFVIENLNEIGWLLDRYDVCNFPDDKSCLSNQAGLAYDSEDIQYWYFSHSESPNALLILYLIDSHEDVNVTMSLY
jgi:hypothetical protein